MGVVSYETQTTMCSVLKAENFHSMPNQILSNLHNFPPECFLLDTSSSVVCIVLTGVSSCCDTAGEGDELRQPGQDEETTGVLDQQSQRRAEEGASRCPPSFLLLLHSSVFTTTYTPMYDNP